MHAKKIYKYDPDYAVAPGETLKEVMESKGMTQKELAVRTGLTVQSLNRIFKGEQPLTYETANRLELVTGVPARFWNNLEALYREQLAKIDERKKLSESVAWLKNIPTKELADRGVIERQTDPILLQRETLRFYGVSSVEAWKEIWKSPAVAARRSVCFETHLGSASAWIRLGELQAEQIECDSYDNSKFKSALEKIRLLTVKDAPVFESELKRFCAESGVALALVKEVKKVPWNGATKWLSPKKAMILLSIRGKGEDKFWFSFFHEAGHVIYDKKNTKNLYIADESDDATEIKADKFASDILIPEKYNVRIQKCRSQDSIRLIASELGIAPGVVAGRYQYLTQKWHIFNGLIRSLKWKT